MAALTAVRLHKNVARGGGTARRRQSTRVYCGSERIAEPQRRRIGAAGRAALAERMEWRGTGGGGFGEYYWLVGRRAVEFGIWGDFRAVGGGSLAPGRFLQVQSHVSVKRQAEERSACMSHVKDRICVRAMRPRQACRECTAFFPFKLGASPPQKKLLLRAIHRYYY